MYRSRLEQPSLHGRSRGTYAAVVPPVNTAFVKLNDSWNAEPNAPMPEVRVDGSDVVLVVFANPWRFADFEEEERIELRFMNASRFRLGATNDEGWYLGQCRFSGVAPTWGEFYEVSGDLRAELLSDWRCLRPAETEDRHFLFYLRDETFECSARDWSMRRLPPL